MAFLQETPRSLRIYLLLVGGLGTAGYLYQVLSEGAPLVRLFALLGLAVSIAFLWVGMSFRSLIISAPARIEQVLIVGAAFSVLLGLVVGVLSPVADERGGAIVEALGGLLVTLYLLRSVRRIARESKAPNSAA